MQNRDLAQQLTLPASWQGAVCAVEDGATVHGWIGRQSAITPDRVAAKAQGADVTYSQLEQRSSAVASALRQLGVRQGSLVGLCLGRGPDLLPAVLGVLKAGAGYVPLDPGFPQDRLQFMVEDAGLAVLLTEPAHAELCGVPEGKRLLIADAISDADSGLDLDAPVSGESTVYVTYTSGSTGKPKGVVVPQRAVCNFLQSMRHTPGLNDNDVLLAVSTLSFDISVLELFLPLIVGAKVVLAQREEAMSGDCLSRLLREQGVTVMQGTPTTWQMLLDSGWQPMPGLRALCGGEPLPPVLAERLIAGGVELWNLYGPTETTVWSTLTRVVAPVRRITIGRPVDNTQVWVLNEKLQPCVVGMEGEICIGGAGVARGYHNRPELSAERFIPDKLGGIAGQRLYRTGDLGRWNADGQLEHMGRIDLQVKIRGYRVEPQEIEEVLARQPGVTRSVVVAGEDSPGDKYLIAYVVPEAGIRLDGAQLREVLRSKLPDYMVPRLVLPLERLPLLPNGKVDRNAMPTLSGYRAAVRIAPDYVAPLTDLERALVPIWESVLGVTPVGVLDDFYSLGGHSILAARLMSRIEEEAGHRLPLEALFEHPNVRAIAAIITERLELADGVMVPLRQDVGGQVLILIAGIGGHVFAFHQFAHSLPGPVRVHGMKAVGINSKEPALSSFEEIAERYVQEILAAEPEGPYVIGGYSIGAHIALETALRLEALDKAVSHVIAFDMDAPGHPKHAGLRKWLQYQLRQIRKGGVGGAVWYLRNQLLHRSARDFEPDVQELEAIGVVPHQVIRNVSAGLLKAQRQYRPAAKLRSAILVVRANQPEEWHKSVERAADLGWSDATGGKVAVQEIDGGHLDLFKAGSRDRLAKIVAQILGTPLW